MIGHTHLALGALAGEAVAITAHASHPLLLIAAGAAGGLWPDLDLPGSIATRALYASIAVTGIGLAAFLPGLRPPTSATATVAMAAAFALLARGSAHRGWTHAVGPYVVLAPIAAWWTGWPVALAGLAGVGSHLLGDLLTARGVPLGWPMDRSAVSLGRVRDGGATDRVIGLTAIAAGMAWWWVVWAPTLRLPFPT